MPVKAVMLDASITPVVLLFNVLSSATASVVSLRVTASLPSPLISPLA